MDKIYTDREQWLNAAIILLINELFIKAGIQPESWELRKYAVSCGFPIGYRGSRTGKVTLGQAFDPAISSNGTAEMFINPIMDDVVEVLLVLLHEMVHVYVGNQEGHKGAFANVAKAVGLQTPLTALMSADGEYNATPLLITEIRAIAEILGEYPHSKVDPQMRKKQGTRMLKISCTDCGFTARASAKWVSLIHSNSPCPVCSSASLVTE